MFACLKGREKIRGEFRIGDPVHVEHDGRMLRNARGRPAVFRVFAHSTVSAADVARLADQGFTGHAVGEPAYRVIDRSGDMGRLFANQISHARGGLWL